MPKIATAVASLAVTVTLTPIVGPFFAGLAGAAVNYLGAMVLGPDQPNLASQAQDRTQILRAPAEAARLIYGTVKASGVLVFAETTGSDKQFLHLVIAIAGHQCRGFREIFIGDESVGDLDGNGTVTSGRFANLARFKWHDGDDNQAADTALMAECPSSWTSAHRGRGVAYLYARLKYDQKAFPGGVPNLALVIDGKLVFDSRDSGTRWTNNWGLCVRDYVAATDGLAADATELDETLAIAAANVSDERVALGRTFTVDAAIDTLTFPEPGLIAKTGAALHLASSGTLPGGLAADTAYYWIRLTDTTGKLASSLANAQGGLAVDITGAGTGTHAVTFAQEVTGEPASDVITLPDVALGVKTGDGVKLAATTSVPGGTAAGTLYYWIRLTPATGKLASTFENALAGTAVNLTSAGTGTLTLTRFDQARYDCNALFKLDQAPRQIMQQLVTGGAGAVAYSQGQFRIFAGAATTYSWSLGREVLRGVPKIEPRPSRARNQLFNAVRARFVDADRYWQAGDLPARTNSLYQQEDNGEQIFVETEFPVTTDSIRGQRLAEILLRRARQGIRVELPCNLRALPVGIWDVIRLTIPELGWANKEFRVVAKTFALPDGFDLSLQEEAASSWDWDGGLAQLFDPAPNTILPRPFEVDPPASLALDSGTAQLIALNEGSVISRILASWPAAAEPWVDSYELQWKKSTDAGWGGQNVGLATQFHIGPVEDGLTYDVRVRTINMLKIPSDWIAKSTVVIGKTEVPPKPASFTVTRTASGTRQFAWTPPVPLPADVRSGGGYRIRYKSGSSMTWGSGDAALHDGLLTSSPYETNQLAAGTWTFAIKTVDSSGNESTDAVYITAELGDPPLAGVLLQRIEELLSPSWPGTLTDCFKDTDNALHAKSNQTWADLPGSWAGLPGAWDTILTNKSPIVYETPVIDLGSTLSFNPLITPICTGTATVTIKTGTPADGTVVGSYAAPSPQVGKRYIQIKCSVADSAAVLRSLATLLEGASATETCPDVNVATESATWFSRVAAGHFKIGSKGGISSLVTAKIDAIQNAGGAATWELISKTQTVNSEVAAEFKTRNSAGTLTDYTVDVTLTGPSK